MTCTRDYVSLPKKKPWLHAVFLPDLKDNYPHISFLIIGNVHVSATASGALISIL